MKFKDLSAYLEKLEHTTSRNTMTEILSKLFAETDKDDIGKIVYLLQGRVAPIFSPLEFGMAEKQMLKALAFAYQIPEKEVNSSYRKKGDLGEVAEELARENKGDGATVAEVFEQLKLLAETGGEGSVEKKIGIVAKILKSVDPLSARFIVRIPVAKLRLGFSDMTVLDALAWMVGGDKAARREIEPVFNIRPDLGYIASTIKSKGIKGLAAATPVPFTPVLMARAERLSSGEEIIDKIGKCAVEPKLDGFRLQAHYKNGEVKLFTRNLEEVTFMYPDVEAGIKNQLKAKEAILEGEAIAYNPETDEFLPFQLTTQRKRKYDIEEFAKKIPLRLICFEILYKDGKNLINETYESRRAELSKTIGKGETLVVAESEEFSDPKKIETFFDEAIAHGLEGIVAKRLDGRYQAGARGWNWIKFKRSYSAALDDTVDCLVMGYYSGRGKRTAFGLGAFLIGVFDRENDKYVTIAKVGTGLTDDEWRELHKRATGLHAKGNEKPPLYDVDPLLAPDFWIEPEIIVEIKADEITRSSIHTAGRIMKPSKSGSAFDVDVSGYALRFPRLEKFRDDRKPEDITSLSEIEKMFGVQFHQNSNKKDSE